MRGHITHQGTVTTSLSVSREELARRAATAKTSTVLAYPGGGDPNNLRIARNDMVMAWKKTAMGPRMPGRPQEHGWVSFNGISMNDYAGLEELADDMYFVGVSRTDFNPMDPLAPQNGIAVIRKGTSDPFYTGKVDAYPGDDMVWSPPLLTEVGSVDNVPQWEGKPRDKLPPVIEPLNFADIEGREHLLVGIANSADPNRGVGHLDFDSITEETRNLTKNQSTALLLKQHAMSSALYIIDALVHAGLLKVMTPEARALESDTLTGVINRGKPNGGGPWSQDDVLALVRASLLGENPGKDPGLAAPVVPTSIVDRTNVTFQNIELENPLAVRTKLAYPEVLNQLKDAQLSASNKTAIIKELTIRKERSLLWLSSILGLTKTPSLKTSRHVQNIVLRGLYPASFQALENNVRNIPRLTTLMKESKSQHEKKLISQYARTAYSFQTRYRLVLAELQYSVTRRFIGKALSHVKPAPNVRIDLLLTTRQ